METSALGNVSQFAQMLPSTLLTRTQADAHSDARLALIAITTHPSVKLSVLLASLILPLEFAFLNVLTGQTLGASTTSPALNDCVSQHALINTSPTPPTEHAG
jgi:hypothetical protein